VTSELPDRLRLRYEKVGRLRFTSQRDLARIWERLLRSVGAPLRYSEGFSPHPILAFAAALPTGAASLAEYLDVRFDAKEQRAAMPWAVGTGTIAGIGDLVAALNERAPEGLRITAAAGLDGTEDSLQEQVALVRWELVVEGLAETEVQERCERMMASSEVLVQRERKGRTVVDDIRGNILTLSTTPGAAWSMVTELRTQPRGIRPMELLGALDPALRMVRATRTHQWIERDGSRREPLENGVFAVTNPLLGATS